MNPLPRQPGEKQKLVLDWSHLEVSNPDCVTFFVVKYWSWNMGKNNADTVVLPANQTSVQLELEDNK